MRRFRCGLILCMLLALLSLCGCGEERVFYGLYVLVDAQSNGISLDVPACTLDLEGFGHGSMELEGDRGSVSWKSRDGSLSLRGKNAAFSGSAEDGRLVVSDGDGLTLTFIRQEQLAAYREENARREAALSESRENWLGDWYGWWRIENTAGSLEDTWYDLCARFALLEDGSLSLILWDEDQSAAKPMAKLRLALRTDGTLVPVDGYFWFMEPGETWVLGQSDGCIRLAGHHAGEGESFDYLLCLRRWGDDWKGAAQKPYYYDTWYQPLLKQGAEMPDKMDIE